MSYFLIALGGSFGAIARYFTFNILQNINSKNVVIETFAVNILGSFFIGITLGLMINGIFFEKGKPESFLFITGFLGAFTTFSTFSQDSVKLLFFEKNILGFCINISANVILGILACGLGYFLIKTIVK